MEETWARAATRYAELTAQIKELEAQRNAIKNQALAEVAENGGQIDIDDERMIVAKPGRWYKVDEELVRAYSSDLWERVSERKGSVALLRAAAAIGIGDLTETDAMEMFASKTVDYLTIVAK